MEYLFTNIFIFFYKLSNIYKLEYNLTKFQIDFLQRTNEKKHLVHPPHPHLNLVSVAESDSPRFIAYLTRVILNNVVTQSFPIRRSINKYTRNGSALNQRALSSVANRVHGCSSRRYPQRVCTPGRTSLIGMSKEELSGSQPES